MLEATTLPTAPQARPKSKSFKCPFVTNAFRPGGYLQLDSSHYLSTLKKDSLGREVNLGSLGFSFFTLQSSALDNSATVPSLFTFFVYQRESFVIIFCS